MAAEIRRVTVELLRRGPRHNQLLSPLTDYLAVCEQSPAGVVNVPYEQADVENLLDDLRYQVASVETAGRLAHTRDSAGSHLALMLGSIPGLPGALHAERAHPGTLTHLRIVMSAAELALLPFELSKFPVSHDRADEGWLALQPDNPICITRHIRSVRGAPARWSTKPRILFVSGDDVPFERHLDAFTRVLERWQTGGLRRDPANPHHWRSDYLDVVELASLGDIEAAMAENAYTHVHVLAHGAEIDEGRSIRYGIALGDKVVSGRELALALSSLTGRTSRTPAVVTLASCDSAAQGSVVTPGGSVAHDLHDAGIPLVVASQFPLSEEASVPFVEIFYRGQMIGEHPLLSITEVRRHLATSYTDEHAWASVVVYESLPVDFESQLEDLCYWQTRRAHDKALVDLEALATSDAARTLNLERLGAPFGDDFSSPTEDHHRALVRAVVEASARLPTEGAYAAECDGLRAAGFKRMAEVAFWLACAPDVTLERRHQLMARCLQDLQSALKTYTATMEAMLGNVETHTHRKATFHWMLGQVLLMRSILGGEIDDDLLGAARLTARLDLDQSDPVVRAWAHVSLVELSMLQLAATSTKGARRALSAQAVHAATEVVDLLGFPSEHVHTTRRQMRRYIAWWGHPQFVEALHEHGIGRRVPWDAPDGVLATARAVVAVLTPPGTADPGRVAVVEPVAPPDEREAAMRVPAPVEPPADHRAARSGLFEIEMLPANNGDCLWVSYGDDADRRRHLLIDCGSVAVAGVASERVRSSDAVELFVLTHIDADHISGALPLFSAAETAERFHDVWFNGWRQLRAFLSVAQGERFSEQLDRDDRPFLWNQTERRDDPPPPIATDGDTHPVIVLGEGMTLTVLSPTRAGLHRLARNWHAALLDLDPAKAMLGRRPRPAPLDEPARLDLVELAASGPTKDSSVPNLSSIAVLAEFGGRAVLFTGDAHADVLTASIRSLQQARGRAGQPLRLDALKLSHHGSANATTRELLESIDCSHYLVPTDGSGFYHPDRSAIARVILHGGDTPTLHFNYRTDLNELWSNAALQERYGYATCYPPADTSGLTVTL